MALHQRYPLIKAITTVRATKGSQTWQQRSCPTATGD